VCYKGEKRERWGSLITIVVQASQVEEVRALPGSALILESIIELVKGLGRGFGGAAVQLGSGTGGVVRWYRGDNLTLKLIIIVRALFKRTSIPVVLLRPIRSGAHLRTRSGGRMDVDVLLELSLGHVSAGGGVHSGSAAGRSITHRDTLVGLNIGRGGPGSLFRIRVLQHISMVRIRVPLFVMVIDLSMS